MTEGHPHSSVGSLADEAGQLLDAVAARLDDLKSATGSEDRQDEAAPVCLGWCPICRSAGLLRGDRPELAGRLLDAALLVVTTLRSMIGEHPGPAGGSGPTTDPAKPDARVANSQPPGGVERIDIR